MTGADPDIAVIDLEKLVEGVQPDNPQNFQRKNREFLSGCQGQVSTKKRPPISRLPNRLM